MHLDLEGQVLDWARHVKGKLLIPDGVAAALDDAGVAHAGVADFDAHVGFRGPDGAAPQRRDAADGTVHEPGGAGQHRGVPRKLLRLVDRDVHHAMQPLRRVCHLHALPLVIDCQISNSLVQPA